MAAIVSKDEKRAIKDSKKDLKKTHVAIKERSPTQVLLAPWVSAGLCFADWRKAELKKIKKNAKKEEENVDDCDDNDFSRLQILEKGIVVHWEEGEKFYPYVCDDCEEEEHYTQSTIHSD